MEKHWLEKTASGWSAPEPIYYGYLDFDNEGYTTQYVDTLGLDFVNDVPVVFVREFVAVFG